MMLAEEEEAKVTRVMQNVPSFYVMSTHDSVSAAIRNNNKI